MHCTAERRSRSTSSMVGLGSWRTTTRHVVVATELAAVGIAAAGVAVDISVVYCCHLLYCVVCFVVFASMIVVLFVRASDPVMQFFIKISTSILNLVSNFVPDLGGRIVISPWYRR